MNSIHLQLAMKGGEIAAWELDPSTGKVTWTDSMFEWLGLDRESCSPCDELFYSRVHPDDLPRVKNDIAQSLRTGAPFESEFRIVTPGNGTRWLMGRGTTAMDSSGRPVRTYGVNLDITRRKILEERELQSLVNRAAIRTAFNMILAMPDPVLLLDSKLNIIGANSAAEAMFGMSTSESVGQSIVNLVPTFLEGPDRGTALLILEKIAGGTIPRIEPLNVRSTDGRRLVVIPQAGYLPADPGGRPGMVFLTFRDVTDLQKARNEAVKNQGRLRSLASRLASSEEEGRWRISRQLHDTVIQTLSLVRMRLASLSDRCDDGLTKHELEEILKWISTATGECRQLMADLNPSMLYELGLVPALNDLAVKFRSLHAVLVSVEGKDNVAIADRSLLGFLFHATRELMTNAVKHSGASRISVLVGRADGGVEVSVRDDGRGFDPEHVEASIERRTGFGLFSVRERLDGLGGQIRIKSEIGKGTLVTIFLPLDGRARPSLIRTAGMGGAGEGGRS